MGSSVFRGNNEINLDVKGRLAIPARYRDGLMSQCDGALVITIDIKDKCLFVYPLPEWEKTRGLLRRGLRPRCLPQQTPSQ